MTLYWMQQTNVRIERSAVQTGVQNPLREEFKLKSDIINGARLAG